MELVHALYNGFKFGFPIHFQGPRVSLYAKNLASAYEHRQIVSAKIFKELEANRLAEPFDSPPVQYVQGISVGSDSQENIWRISHDTPSFLSGWVFD